MHIHTPVASRMSAMRWQAESRSSWFMTLKPASQDFDLCENPSA